VGLSTSSPKLEQDGPIGLHGEQEGCGDLHKEFDIIRLLQGEYGREGGSGLQDGADGGHFDI